MTFATSRRTARPLWRRGGPRHRQPRHRRRSRGCRRGAVAAAGARLPHRLVRRPAGEGPRRPLGPDPRLLSGCRGHGRRRPRSARHLVARQRRREVLAGRPQRPELPRLRRAARRDARAADGSVANRAPITDDACPRVMPSANRTPVSRPIRFNTTHCAAVAGRSRHPADGFPALIRRNRAVFLDFTDTYILLRSISVRSHTAGHPSSSRGVIPGPVCLPRRFTGALRCPGTSPRALPRPLRRR